MLVAAIIEARSVATRLPYKVLRPLAQKPMLHWVIKRAAAAERVDRVVVATPGDEGNGAVFDMAAAAGADVVSGPMDDVLTRDLRAADAVGADTIVRLTGDNPFVDALLIDEAVSVYHAGNVQFVSTCRPGMDGQEPTYPRGIAVEVFAAEALRRHVTDFRPSTREHVTTPFYAGNAARALLDSPYDARWRDELRLTVDTYEDYYVASILYDTLGPYCRLGEVIAYCERHPELTAMNRQVPVKPVRG